MSDYGEKLLRLLVAETHCLTVLVAAQGMGRDLRDLSDEDREKHVRTRTETAPR